MDERVYRCEGCSNVLFWKHIQTGGCPHCNCRRIKVATMVNDAEQQWLKDEGYEFRDEQWEVKATPLG